MEIKELTVFERLCENIDRLGRSDLLKLVRLETKIAKKLKALEIIKKYQVDVALLLDSSCEEEYLNRCCNRYIFNMEMLAYKRLGKDNFDLLKEVLS